MTRKIFILALLVVFLQNTQLFGQEKWYIQGNFIPEKRIVITLKNTLSFDRKDVPVTVDRSLFPFTDFQDFDVTVVEPLQEGRPEPSVKALGNFGVHLIRGESNGRMTYHQLDDLNKDGLWDELFFITNIKANETKTIYLYIGYNNRGWNEYTTAATMGSYVRHLVPFWENEYVGWKLWYPADIDVYGKRKPQLITQKLSLENLDGYGVAYDMGSDIMAVGNSMGGGGIAVFDNTDNPSQGSRPRFTPAKAKSGKKTPFNVGQDSDTRYSFDIIVNGPVRSIVKTHTFNWDSGYGKYELEQTYTSYTRQNYSTCKVKFIKFKPKSKDAYFGCGIKRHPNQLTFLKGENIIVTGGPEAIVNPDDPKGDASLKVDFISTALIVKKKYKPQFEIIKSDTISNYAFKVKPTKNKEFEYLIGAAWSEGQPFKTNEEFKNYMVKTENEYENPLQITLSKIENK
jgi:hypothetical protein